MTVATRVRHRIGTKIFSFINLFFLIVLGYGTSPISRVICCGTANLTQRVLQFPARTYNGSDTLASKDTSSIMKGYKCPGCFHHKKPRTRRGFLNRLYNESDAGDTLRRRDRHASPASSRDLHERGYGSATRNARACRKSP